MAFDFNYENTTIQSGGGFKPSKKNAPVDVRTVVDTYADIASIPNPYIGLTVTVKTDETNENKMTDYKVISLKANGLGVPNMLVDEVKRMNEYIGVSNNGNGNVDLSGYVLKTELSTSLSNKVDKVSGYSLVSDTEIARLANVDNYDDTEIRGLIPTKVSELQNDMDFVVDEEMDGAISSALDGHTFRFLTQAEYDLLTEDEQNDGTAYMITDSKIAADIAFDDENNKLNLIDDHDSPLGIGVVLNINATVDTTNYYNKDEINDMFAQITIQSPSGKKYFLVVNDNGELSTSIIVAGLMTDVDEILFVGQGSQTLNVKLDREPTSEQTVTISSSNPDVTVSPSELIFTNSDYDTFKQVTITNTSSDVYVSSDITVSTGTTQKVIIAQTTSIDQDNLVVWLDANDMDSSSNTATLQSRVGDGVLTLDNFAFDGTDGWTGSSLKFTKSGAQFASMPMPTGFVRNSPITIQVSYKLGTNLHSYGRVFAVGEFYFNQAATLDNNKIGCLQGDVTIDPEDNQYNIAVIRYNPENTSLSVFLNGELISSKEISISASTQNIIMNNIYFNKEATAANPIDYELGSFLIYSKALTDDEIHSLYAYESAINR